MAEEDIVIEGGEELQRVCQGRRGARARQFQEWPSRAEALLQILAEARAQAHDCATCRRCLVAKYPANVPTMPLIDWVPIRWTFRPGEAHARFHIEPAHTVPGDVCICVARAVGVALFSLLGRGPHCYLPEEKAAAAMKAELLMRLAIGPERQATLSISSPRKPAWLPAATDFDADRARAFRPGAAR